MGPHNIRVASCGRSVLPPAAFLGLLLVFASGGPLGWSARALGQSSSGEPVISSFTASSASIHTGSTSNLNWATSGATSITINPGNFQSTAADGFVAVAPTITTAYTLTATNSEGSVTARVTIDVITGSLPAIKYFTSNPKTVAPGNNASLYWESSGGTSISINPGSFTSLAATGSVTVTPETTTTYNLLVRNLYGAVKAVTTVTVTPPPSALSITTTSCPGGTQNTPYAGCKISVTGGTPPYAFNIKLTDTYASLPEGLSLNRSTGAITGAIIGGQGTYKPEFVVNDSAGHTVNAGISFSINGSNAFLSQIFPSDSIFHHRVDAATTGLPVDTSPAAPIYSSYLTATIKPFFGNITGSGIPNGIPAIEVPYNQPDVAVSTTKYQSYFNSGPIPAYAPIEATSHSTGDRHVLVYQDGGNGKPPALYEMWVGIYENGPWTDSSNALWPDVTSDNLTLQGEGTSDAAGLPVAPLLVNADEVIGTGTPAAPNGVIQHPIRFTVNHMLNYWVWPATQTAGVGYCIHSGQDIAVDAEMSQTTPPDSCTMSGPAGEIYRLSASAPTPACAATSPQAAIIITAFRNYGIILADNGESGGLIGTPDARWNDQDLACLINLTLSDFEPVNVSSLMVTNSSGQTQP